MLVDALLDYLAALANYLAMHLFSLHLVLLRYLVYLNFELSSSMLFCLLPMTTSLPMARCPSSASANEQCGQTIVKI